MIFLTLFQIVSSFILAKPEFQEMSIVKSLALTNEMARELGMQSMAESIKLAEDQFDLSKRYNLDVDDDQRNRFRAPVVIIVNKGKRTSANPEGQSAKLFVNGEQKGSFDVATGINQMVETTSGDLYFASTPVGFFRIKKAYDNYFSNAFFGAYMRYAMFFDGGVALHATTHTDSLGKIGSGGCVRMRDEDIALISEAVLNTGKDSREVKIEPICKNGDCFERELYLNRKEVRNVNEQSGELTNFFILSYDSLVIVKEGTQEKEESRDPYDI